MRIMATNFSRKNFKNSFYLFLLISLALHLISISKHFKVSRVSPVPLTVDEKAPIKLKLVQEKKKQIVETQQSESEANLEKIKDRFLSNKKNLFKKETIASKVGKFKNASSSKSGKKGLKSNDSLKKISLKDFALSDLSKFQVQKSQSKGDSQNSKSNTKPSQISQTNDFIDDVPIGELTQLNTSEFQILWFLLPHKAKT